MIIINYRGHTIRLVPEMRQGKQIYWIYIDHRQISFVSNPDTGKRIGTQFLDTILDPGYMDSKTNGSQSGKKLVGTNFRKIVYN